MNEGNMTVYPNEFNMHRYEEELCDWKMDKMTLQI
jgi:hypothetical protein